MKIFICSLLFSSVVYAESIEIRLLQAPCQPKCSAAIEETFKVHSGVSRVTVLAKYKTVYLETISWIRDQTIKDMIKKDGSFVISIKRFKN